MSSNIHFAMGGAIFGDFTLESIQLIAKHGLPGVEPYRGHLMAWLDKPQALKDLLDEYGIRLITASNGDEQRLWNWVQNLYFQTYGYLPAQSEMQAKVNALASAGGTGSANH